MLSQFEMYSDDDYLHILYLLLRQQQTWHTFFKHAAMMHVQSPLFSHLQMYMQ